MIKITMPDTKTLMKQIERAAQDQLIKKPAIIEDATQNKVNGILRRFRDPTGIQPRVRCKANSLARTGGSNISSKINIEVLNGDEAYKSRVIEFIKSNLG
jgi:hypothetical protein